jgi:flagellar biosynthesis protein FlhG
MIDQADELRQMFSFAAAPALAQPRFSPGQAHNPGRSVNATPRAKIITITSGKGGVGKSNVALSLAIALAQLEQKVLLIDADIALANLDVLLGLHPRYTLADVIRGRKEVEEIFLSGPAGITLLPASCGALELAERDTHDLFDKLLPQLKARAHDYDFILVDTAAGLTRTVLDFIFFADRVIVMTTPEPTAITDAYAMFKVIGSQPFHPEAGLLVNCVRAREEADEIFDNLMLVVERFLNLNISYIGHVMHDATVPTAVSLQKPLLLAFPQAAATACINAIARAFLDNQPETK